MIVVRWTCTKGTRIPGSGAIPSIPSRLRRATSCVAGTYTQVTDAVPRSRQHHVPNNVHGTTREYLAQAADYLVVLDISGMSSLIHHSSDECCRLATGEKVSGLDSGPSHICNKVCMQGTKGRGMVA